MERIRDGIIWGVEEVVYELRMEEKYQRTAMNALRDGMRRVSR